MIKLANYYSVNLIKNTWSQSDHIMRLTHCTIINLVRFFALKKYFMKTRSNYHNKVTNKQFQDHLSFSFSSSFSNRVSQLHGCLQNFFQDGANTHSLFKDFLSVNLLTHISKLVKDDNFQVKNELFICKFRILGKMTEPQITRETYTKHWRKAPKNVKKCFANLD